MENREICDDAPRHRTTRVGVVALALVIAAVLCVALGGGASKAFAAGTNTLSGDGANWDVPTNAMTNTIWKDASGNVVSEGTEGATQYKVLTVWAEAWSTSGADYLGMSNSAFFGNGGNGNALVTTYEAAAKTTTVGVWATSANESPNAYNWNIFYNLYAATEVGMAHGAEASDWAAISSGNVSTGTSDWSTEAGVWCGFKFRPDVVVTNNNLSEAQAEATIQQIHDGEYSADYTTVTEGEGRDATTIYYAEPDDTGAYDSSYYIYGDENYDPEIIGYNNNSPYSFVASAFQLAEMGDRAIETYSDYEGLGNNALDWKTVNMLPRSNRYTETPVECAVNIEKLAKGSVYYTLSKINDGTVDKKKVAYVAYPWNRSGSPATSDSQVVVAVYDYTENIGTGPMDGRTSWTSLAVDQLGADGNLEVAAERSGGSAVNSSDESTTTYTLYYATADDLADCDVIYCSPNVTASLSEFQDWIRTNSTDQAHSDRATQLSYLLTWPCVTNGSNYTMEKLMYGAFGMDYIYPELFPSMQLSTYWCDNIYHLTDSMLTSAMSWIYSPATLPEGTTLSNIPAEYNSSVVESKLDEGLEYYQNCETDEGTGSTDATIDRVLHNIGIDGSTEYAEDSPYVFNGFQPTEYWSIENPYDHVFTDVAEKNSDNEWYYDAVYNIAAMGLVKGYAPDYEVFGVGDDMTRADFITILWRLSDPDGYADYDETKAVNTSGFTDSADGTYFTEAINWAKTAGVITGYVGEDGSQICNPYGNMTFEEMITMVARLAVGSDEAAGWDTSVLSDPRFTDGDAVSDWAAGPMAWAIDGGLVTGGDNLDGTYTLAPASDVARERVVTVLWRAIDDGTLV